MSEFKQSSIETDFYETVVRTPICETGLSFSGAAILLKDETKQPGESFKIRGALLAALNLSAEQRQNGLVTASAGNHGLGIALASEILSIQAYVFVPEETAPSKIESISSTGAKVVEVKGSVDSALAEAKNFANDLNAAFIHPFDDPRVIKGQSTVAAEIFGQINPDKLFVPVGGGGLLAGCLNEADTIESGLQVYGVQLEGADAFALSLERGQPITLQRVNNLSDGTAVRRAGSIAIKTALESQHFAGAVIVSEAELGEAMLIQEMITGVAAEPAGSLAFAGMYKLATQKPPKRYEGEKWVGIMSGKHRDAKRFKKLIAAAGYRSTTDCVRLTQELSTGHSLNTALLAFPSSHFSQQ